MCLRQLCGVLAGARLPSADADAAHRAIALRALALASEAWRRAWTDAGASAASRWRGVDKLVKDGENALATARREASRLTACASAPGDAASRGVGAVAAEAAAAASATYAALVTCGARAPGAEAAQETFAAPVLRDDDDDDGDDGGGAGGGGGGGGATRDPRAWPTRVFASRALATALAPGHPTHAGTPRSRECLAPAMTLLALTAASEAASGGVGPLAAALFAHPAARALHEGATRGPGAAAATRLQRAARGEVDGTEGLNVAATREFFGVAANASDGGAPRARGAQRRRRRRRRRARRRPRRRALQSGGGLQGQRGGALRVAARVHGANGRGRARARRRAVPASRARVPRARVFCPRRKRKRKRKRKRRRRGGRVHARRERTPRARRVARRRRRRRGAMARGRVEDGRVRGARGRSRRAARVARALHSFGGAARGAKRPTARARRPAARISLSLSAARSRRRFSRARETTRR